MNNMEQSQSAPNMQAFLGAMQGAGQQPSQAQPSTQPPQAQAQSQVDPQIQQMIDQLMKMGRGGDTALAHLTPGEIAVPPEVQTPKVLATLKTEYNKKGVDPEQFTVGSPQSSLNPQSGLPEYNFMSAFLPAALGIAGSVAMPWLAPGMGALMASSVGGGLGSTAGGLLAGQKPMQAVLGGLGAGLGGYALGGLTGGASSAAAANAPKAIAPTMSANGLSNSFAGIPGAQLNPANIGLSNSFQGISGAIPASESWKTAYGLLPAGQTINPMQAAGSFLGGQVGSYLGAPQKPYQPPRPPGFNDTMPPVGQLAPWNEQLGQTTYNGPTANFANYNPLTNSPMAHRFY